MQTARWWQTGVIYQVYPRSFQDADGDGVGDLRGITQRLPYLVELGVDAIWMSPIFTSPMADFGYDVADYNGIDPLFGTLADFDALLAAAHARGIKVILDLVPNHTSDQHAWFVDSRSTRTSAKRDWYIWRDPGPGGGPPNNWLSVFGGSAWTYDEATRQHYYHAFLPQQPDLNWRNPQVRAAIYDVMRFWLRRGVDGFRVDVIWHLIKDEAFRDNPPNPAFRPDEPPHHALVPLYTTDRPEVHVVISEMRRVIDEFADRLLIGEIYLPLERLIAYYGRDLTGLHLPFNFSMLSAVWHPQSLAKLVEEYEAALPSGGWPNWVLGNHDRPRIASPSVLHRPASLRCCCSHCAALRPSITAMKSECRTSRYRASASAIQWRITCQSAGSVETAAVRRCNGTPHVMPGFPKASPGSPCRRRHSMRMSRTSSATVRLCFRSIVG
jgi:alpha-glucosidase